MPAVQADQLALARVGRALADESRRRILLALLDGCHYPQELADRLSLGKANVSNHLACLRGCGLVTAAPEGRRVRYDFVDERLAQALADLAAVVLLVEDRCDLAAAEPRPGPEPAALVSAD
jgi:DNA-binding transcriptional ArsR family regulator